MKQFIFVFALLSLFASLQAQDTASVTRLSVVVPSVHDGDSFRATYIKIEVEQLEGDTVRVLPRDTTIACRILGIDAPEVAWPEMGVSTQDYGRNSGDSLRLALKLQGNVTIVPSHIDGYGRTVTRVYKAEKDIAQHAIRRGWAHYVSSPKLTRRERRAYAYAQKQAKAQRLGLWASENVVKPADWRRRS